MSATGVSTTAEATTAGLTVAGEGQPRSARRWFVLIVVLLGALLVMIAVSAVNLAIPSMRLTLNASFGQIQLVIAGYTLVYATFLIAGGRLGDIYGRKRAFLVGVAVFTLAAAAGGLAPNTATLIIARMVQGLGAAFMYPQFLSLIQDTFEGRERDMALGLFGATIGLGVVVGQLLGGLIISLDIAGLTWRPAFLVLVPIGACTMLGAQLVLTHRASSAPAARFDGVGVVALAVTLSLFIFPLVAGREAGWPIWMLLMLGASIPAGGLFLWLEARIARRGASPLLDPDLFRQRAFAVGCLLGLAFMAGIAGFIFITSLTLQVGLGVSAINAGLVQAPLGIAFLVASLLTPRLTNGLGRHVLSLGYVILLLGLLTTLAVLRASGGSLVLLTLVPGFIVMGLGQGFGLTPLIGTVLSGVRREDMGAAAGALPTAFQVGQVLGIALIGLVFFSALGAEPLRNGLEVRYLGAFQTALPLLAALPLLSLVLVFALPRPTVARANVFLERVPNRLAGLVYSLYFATGGHAGERALNEMIQHAIQRKSARVEEAPADPGEFLVHHYQRTRDEDVAWIRYLIEEALAVGSGPVPHESERQPQIDRQVEEIRSRQGAGLIHDEFDADTLRVLAFALSSYPRLLPQVARMATGLSPLRRSSTHAGLACSGRWEAAWDPIVQLSEPLVA